MPIACVTFDLDDTLWECAPVLERAEQAFFDWLARHCPRIVAGHDRHSLHERRRAHYLQHPELIHDVTALRKHWLAAVAAEAGYGEEVVEGAFAVFIEQRNRVQPYPGVAALLERLRSRYTLGAITNGNADLDRVGLGALFDFVVTAAAAGAAKPERAIFEFALARAGIAAGQAVHVGDDPCRDVLGAARAGMRSVWLNPRLIPWPGGRVPDAVIRTLDELDALLLGWG